MKKLFILLFLLINFSYVYGLSQGFVGEVTYANNLNVPDGYVITSGINGVIKSYSEIKDGFYKLVIESKNNGLPIEFYLNGEKLEKTSLVENFKIEDLNFYIEELPKKDIFCGNNKCENDECDYCAVDCSYITCSRNNVCNLNVGEDCSNSFGDCGICNKSIDESKIDYVEEKFSEEKEIKRSNLITGASVAFVDTTINYGWIMLTIIFLMIMFYEFKKR